MPESAPVSAGRGPLFFLDLDDTLFQTARKMSEAQRERAVVAAVDRQGKPSSFMTETQRNLLDWLNENACLIPVTGRGTEELGRVRIAFRSWRIATHGAVILTPDGSEDAVWRERILGIVRPLRDELRHIAQCCTDYFVRRGYDAFARINQEYRTDIYLVMKHRDNSRLPELYAVVDDVLSGMDLSHFVLSSNDNNISLLPRGIDKAAALRHLLVALDAEGGARPTVGLGDSLSDMPFLALCDWWGMPRHSQLAGAVGRIVGEGER